MKWQQEAPKVGDKRTITRFLWKPLTNWSEASAARRKLETRWLERASWLETYISGGWIRDYWIDERPEDDD